MYFRSGLTSPVATRLIARATRPAQPSRRARTPKGRTIRISKPSSGADTRARPGQDGTGKACREASGGAAVAGARSAEGWPASASTRQPVPGSGPISAPHPWPISATRPAGATAAGLYGVFYERRTSGPIESMVATARRQHSSERLLALSSRGPARLFAGRLL
jgi:hypothetical protein